MVFQDPMASLNPRWRVGALIGEPLLELQPTLAADEREARVVALLQRVGLAAEDRHRWPHEFSGGQRQRIAIARALITAPALLVCDEPTSALDVSVQAQVLALLGELQQEHRLTLVVISHNLAVVRQISDEVGVMLRGRLVEAGPAEAVFERPQHAYTRALLEAVPDPRRLSQRRAAPSG
jgi:ABC-type microcin C transport system duplicated ATPase subunit YejF